MSLESLWPKDLAIDNDEPTPGLILRQQAEFLGDLTRQLVEGDVRTVTSQGKLIHRLYAKAPLLDYRVQIVELRHDWKPYPVDLVWKNESGSIDKAENPEELRGKLRAVFEAHETRRIIGQLQAYQRESGLPFLLVENQQVVGEARTHARAVAKARELVGEGGEILIFQNGVQANSVSKHNGEIFERPPL